MTMLDPFNAIVPMAVRRPRPAIAAMLAEAFREPGERMPIGRPRPHRPDRRGASRPCCCGTATPSSFGVVVADNFALFVTVTLIVVGILSLAFSAPTVERERLPAGEYYALMLFAIAGMMLMATATDLLVIFLALEVLSLAVYVLTGIRRDSPAGDRGGVQVLPARRLLERVLPLRHRVHLRRHRQHAARSHRQPDRGAGDGADADDLLALGLLLVGFAFKVSAVPFHMWTPDAYEGAPPAVTGFMSTGVKAAAFAAFVRVFLSALEPLHAAVGAGALAICRGDDDRRHGRRRGADATSSGCSRTRASRTAATCWSALVAANDVGKGAILFYLLTYAVTNLGAFGVDRAARHRASGRTTSCATTPACGTTSPALAALMTIFLLSLGGFPPTAGFIAQVVHLQRRGQGRLLPAGDHRRADERRSRSSSTCASS